jgi:hypothetical protein
MKAAVENEGKNVFGAGMTHKSGMRFMQYKRGQSEKGRSDNPHDIKPDGPEPEQPKFRS